MPWTIVHHRLDSGTSKVWLGAWIASTTSSERNQWPSIESSAFTNSRRAHFHWSTHRSSLIELDRAVVYESSKWSRSVGGPPSWRNCQINGRKSDFNDRFKRFAHDECHSTERFTICQRSIERTSDDAVTVKYWIGCLTCIRRCWSLERNNRHRATIVTENRCKPTFVSLCTSRR